MRESGVKLGGSFAGRGPTRVSSELCVDAPFTNGI